MGDGALRNAVGDLTKNVQTKKNEGKALESKIVQLERQLKEVVEPTLKEKIEQCSSASSKVAEAGAALDSKEKKRDEEMDQHSHALLNLKKCDRQEKDVKEKMHLETIRRFAGHTIIFNKLKYNAKTAVLLRTGGNADELKEAENAKHKEYLAELKAKIEEARQKRDDLLARNKSREELASRNVGEIETAISKGQKEALNLEEREEKAMEKLRK